MLLVVAGALTLLPAGAVLLQALTAEAQSPERASSVWRVSWTLLASSIAWAGAIAVLATLLAWPASWALASRGNRSGEGRGAQGWLWALACVPLLMPSYLSYHALGLARAPGTILGDWLTDLGSGGAPWAPALAGRLTAVLALALWSWPIAALILTPAVRVLERDLRDALRTDGAGASRTTWELARALRTPLLWALATITLLMLGSAVPLHLAQAPTYAVRVWYETTLRPGSWEPFASAWPVALLCAAGGALLVRAALRGMERGGSEEVGAAPRPTRLHAWALAGLVVLGVLLPLVLEMSALREARSIGTFVRAHAGALRGSGATALLVGLLASMLAALGALAASGLGRRGRTRGGITSAGARTACVALAACAALPGVLVGQAVLALDQGLDRTISGAGWIWEGGWVVFAHLARFAGLAVLAGVWIGLSEPRSVREARAVDGGMGWIGWWRAWGKGNTWPLLGVGVACACLSLHEVEASILVQPAGAGSLAHVMLANLHFVRVEELAAGTIVVLGTGLVLALLAGAMLWAWSQTPKGQTREEEPGTGREKSW